MDKAEEVFERLLERKIRPNTVAYNALLSGYAILPKPDVRKAFHYFNHVIMTNNNIISILIFSVKEERSASMR